MNQKLPQRVLPVFAVWMLILSLAGCTLAPQPAPAQVLPSATAPPAATAVSSPTWPPTASAPAPSSTPFPMPEYLVLISIDGGRPEYFDLANMPHLDELRSRGAYYPDAWVGALQNNTPAGHTEIATGSFPRNNGIPGYILQDLSTGEIHQPTTEEAVNAGEMAAIIEQSGAPTLAGLIKSKYPRDAVISVSAHKWYAAQALGAGPADIIFYSRENPDSGRFEATGVEGRQPEPEVLSDPRLAEAASHPGRSNFYALTAARVLFEHHRPRALLVNLPETDDRGHATGGLAAPDVIREVLESTDRGLGELIQAYREAGIFDRTLWVVTADHGMTPKKNLLVADDLFARLSIQEEEHDRLNLPEGYLANPDRAFDIAEKLAASQTPGIEAIYVRVESAGMYSYQPAPSSSGVLPEGLDAAYRYLLGTYAGRFSPNIIAMTAEGVVFDKDLNGAGGSHNEVNWANQHIFAIFSGPGVAAGQVSYAPARLVDLAPTIARLMGLPQGEMDGSVLADALLEPRQEDIQAFQEFERQISPLRDALEANSLR